MMDDGVVWIALVKKSIAMDVIFERILVHVSVKEKGALRGPNTYTAKKPCVAKHLGKHKRQHLRRFLLLALAVSKSLTHHHRKSPSAPLFQGVLSLLLNRRSRNFFPIFFLVLSGITTWLTFKLSRVVFRVVLSVIP